MRDVALIEDPAVAAAALDPIRSRLLAELATPGSAASLAQRVGLPRQKVNYHLRALEEKGLVEVAEERRHGGLTERVLQATAASYIVSPQALGKRALASRYLIALAGRLLREVAELDPREDTLGLDAEIKFASPDDRAAFAAELTEAVTQLASKYHHDGGKPHRLVVATHPIQEHPQ
ncbi:helix-turn-helix domain-containing protein [Solirubrobacter sp. CPCC 204708]|uniref:Helix-turn-helix domain-containing protein n=1 Tax=Solirubrobacter deserti TaxID=2282478 RepID=A0ABT4RM21_9ACTN|nr:transcriptional regulator [Solirubrobacter deserti]MBE2320453.1 helix-turn-helix domain-containing protein [Solirubrobacter deserti]MDA0139356.1 helix-turn-helix domain-containing protein [Solirubrobacter deserti]